MVEPMDGASGALNVTWDPIATFYNLVYIPSDGNTSSNLDNTTETSVAISDLTPGKRYVFILSAYVDGEERQFLSQTSYTLGERSLPPGCVLCVCVWGGGGGGG